MVWNWTSRPFVTLEKHSPNPLSTCLHSSLSTLWQCKSVTSGFSASIRGLNSYVFNVNLLILSERSDDIFGSMLEHACVRFTKDNLCLIFSLARIICCSLLYSIFIVALFSFCIFFVYFYVDFVSWILSLLISVFCMRRTYGKN